MAVAVAVAQKNKPVVIDPEKSLDKKLTRRDYFVFSINVRDKDKDRDAFLVLKASTLNQFSDNVIQQSLAMGNLRVVFVLDMKNTDRFFDKVQELGNPNLVKKLFRTTEFEQIDRILHAWCRKREANTIASAYVDQEHGELVVQACDLEFYRVKFKDFPGLSKLTAAERLQFKIDEWGHDLRWTAKDVAIDLDVIRYKADEEFRRAKDMAALSAYKEFVGKALRTVMEKHGFKSKAELTEKGGPDPRQFLRIEKGHNLTPNMLDRLAKAHDLTSKEYVEELIEACNEIVEEEVDAIEESAKRSKRA